MESLADGGDEKSVRVSDIAKAAGVSPGAVSSLFTSTDGRGRVSPETRATILKVSRKLGYRPKDPRALSLIYPDLGGFCFMLPESAKDGVRNPYYSHLFAGVVEELAMTSAQVTFCQFADMADYRKQSQALPTPLMNGSATRYLCAGQPNLSLLEAIHQNGGLAICMGQYAPVQGVTSILPDYSEGARQALEHLIGLGHRRIAFALGSLGSNASNVIDQRRVVETVMNEHGIPLEPEYTFFVPLQPSGGIEAVDRIVRCEKRPTALYCFNDGLAAGAIGRAQQLGLKVPEDISISGFDDIPMAANLHPALTTVHVPIEQIGRMAVREMIAQTSAGKRDEADAPRRIVLPTALVIRASTAAPRPE